MIVLVLWFFIVLVLSVIPASGPKTDLPADKIAHFVLYGFSAILLFRYLIRKTDSRSAFYKAVAFATIYGAAMEVVQYFLPYRSFSLGDMAANAAGAFLACLAYKKVRPKKDGEA
jgi:VanZ family protein